MAEGEESVESLVNRSIANMTEERDETLPQTVVEKSKVAYIFSYKLLNLVTKLPRVKGRVSLILNQIKIKLKLTFFWLF